MRGGAEEMLGIDRDTVKNAIKETLSKFIMLIVHGFCSQPYSQPRLGCCLIECIALELVGVGRADRHPEIARR